MEELAQTTVKMEEENKGEAKDVTLSDGTINGCATIQVEESTMKQEKRSYPTFLPILAKALDSSILAAPKAPFTDRVPKAPKADRIPKGPAAGRLWAASMVGRGSVHWDREIKNPGAVYNARKRYQRVRAFTPAAEPAPASMYVERTSAASGLVGTGVGVKVEAGTSMQAAGNRSSLVRSIVQSTQNQRNDNTTDLLKKRKLEFEEGEVKVEREQDFYAAEREEMNRKRDAHKSKKRARDVGAPAVTEKTWAQRAAESRLAAKATTELSIEPKPKTKTWEERAREVSGRAMF